MTIRYAKPYRNVPPSLMTRYTPTVTSALTFLIIRFTAKHKFFTITNDQKSDASNTNTLPNFVMMQMSESKEIFCN